MGELPTVPRVVRPSILMLSWNEVETEPFFVVASNSNSKSWEMNGLLTVKRRKNGYRIYTEEDIRRLKIIRSLRCANYSLEAILSMLSQLAEDPDLDIRKALDTPRPDAEIIAVCDKLITSLTSAEENACQMLCMLQNMKRRFGKPSS